MLPIPFVLALFESSGNPKQAISSLPPHAILDVIVDDGVEFLIVKENLSAIRASISEKGCRFAVGPDLRNGELSFHASRYSFFSRVLIDCQHLLNVVKKPEGLIASSRHPS